MRRCFELERAELRDMVRAGIEALRLIASDIATACASIARHLRRK